ncbi:MAG: hypothetical protein KAI25_15190, partial [Hyphomicrobiaceae bacterium]|nr:hypothetical protein [Hyphomicrobiaceae bacterium]
NVGFTAGSDDKRDQNRRKDNHTIESVNSVSIPSHLFFVPRVGHSLQRNPRPEDKLVTASGDGYNEILV